VCIELLAISVENLAEHADDELQSTKTEPRQTRSYVQRCQTRFYIQAVT